MASYDTLPYTRIFIIQVFDVLSHFKPENTDAGKAVVFRKTAYPDIMIQSLVAKDVLKELVCYRCLTLMIRGRAYQFCF